MSAPSPAPASPHAGRLACWGLGIALALGAFARLWQLSSQSIYLDEAFVMDAAHLPIPAMLQFLAAHDAHPPLFYFFAHAAVTHLAWPPTWYRYLTAPFGLLTIFCTWALARRAFGDVAAALAAIVVATEPTLLLFDRLFRMYSILTALTASSFWLLTTALAAKGRRRVAAWTFYALVALALPCVHYLGAMVIVCQGAFALGDLRRRWPILASGFASALALAPWWWGIKQQLPLGGFAGGQTVVSGWTLARQVLGYALPVDWYRTGAFDIALTCAALAVIGFAIWLARGGIVGWYIAPLVLQAAVTALAHRNLLYGRYLVYLVPGFAIACGAVAAGLLRVKTRVAGMLFFSAILAVNGVADTNLLLDKFYQLSDWNMVGTIIAAHERASDVMVFDQGFAYVVLRSSPGVAGHDVRGPEQQAELPSVLHWLDRQAGRRVWYVENQRAYPDPSGAVKKHLDATRRRLNAWLEPRADASNMVYVALYGPTIGRVR